MNARKVLLHALTDWRPLGLLAPFLVAAAGLGNPFLALLGLGVYGMAAQRLAGSARFQGALAAGAARVQTAREMEALAAAARAVPGPGPQRVLAAARSLYDAFSRAPEADTPRALLVAQGLKLAALYVRIAAAQQVLKAAPRPGPADMQGLARRILDNLKKLDTLSDAAARQTLARAVALDKQTLARLGETGDAAEQAEAELLALESALAAVRRRFFSPDEAVGGESVDAVITEAEALDAALEEVRARTRARA